MENLGHIERQFDVPNCDKNVFEQHIQPEGETFPTEVTFTCGVFPGRTIKLGINMSSGVVVWKEGCDGCINNIPQ